MGVYRLEVSKGNRAGCKNKECLDNGVKIQKGELRFGTQVEFQEHQSWHWRHWGCVTPKQLANLNETIEGNFDYLDGYDEITPEMQEKVKTALEQGHVDDDDWKGDVEFNRPGKTGMRKRTPKKKETEDAAENNEDPQSPTKSGSKKRARTKKTTEGQDEETAEAPSPKKAKTTAKRSKKAEAAPENANSEDEKPIAKKKAKRSKQVEDVGDQEMAEKEVPVPKERSKRNSRKPASYNVDEQSEEEPAAQKRGKANGKSAAKKKTEASNSKVEPEEHDMDSKESIEKIPKANKGRKRAPVSKKTKSRAKKTGTEAVDDDNAVEAG